jgi:short subunit dehydrogenase-like uncharacterized protein
LCARAGEAPAAKSGAAAKPSSSTGSEKTKLRVVGKKIGASQKPSKPAATRSEVHQIDHAWKRGTVAARSVPWGSAASRRDASGQVEARASPR